MKSAWNSISDFWNWSLSSWILALKVVVIACMAWFRRRQDYLCCEYFFVTPVFQIESMFLLKFTCIFLKAPSRQHFCLFSRAAPYIVRNRSPIISMYIQCLRNGVSTGLHDGTTLVSLRVIGRQKSLKKHTYVHIYMHTYIHTCPHTNKHHLSLFSIACWTPVSRLRRQASVWFIW